MLKGLPLPVFVGVVLFFLAMAGVAIAAGLHARRRAALVAATPTSPIGMATDGYREFEGKVEAVDGRSIAAPLTAWACCWYHATIERFVRRRGSESGGWRLVKEWTSGAPFLVRDATGVCMVDPHRAEVVPTDMSRWYGSEPRPKDRNPPKRKPTESTTPTMEVAGEPDSTYRYTEERIYAGDPLLVLGEFTSGRFTAPPAVAGAEEPDVLIDGEGEEYDGGARALPEDERETVVRLEVEDELLDRARAITPATIGRGSGARPFILTTSSRADHMALSSLGGNAALGIALVPLAIALLLIWARFG